MTQHTPNAPIKVGIIMGSQSDWPTMREAADILEQLGVPYETRVPVVGVPVQTKALSGVDSLYSILQMPRGFPVATMAIGGAGATNAALMAASILALQDPELASRLNTWRNDLSASIPDEPTDD